ncbi:angiogenic factor with G patch and FHA domains 1 isoform X2 [Maylandia zebra]|uniref:angiogenic factor with G patch and FHA domains 1 isoform X2 n=1 Tax=Maylandia zebra TaxID=106582 RepID=UPI000646F323|nr:angiogenic factor with G patch and FHA domains 1 isoform X2 [Maylandia zebra]XP_026024272.1 angiogenic factor with G patch and FHA domains 1 isoform X2 [Astatotilapia calliptera]
MENDDSHEEKDTEPEVAKLRLKVESLKQELKECRAELAKLQKQLSHSERLQRSTEGYNEDLRKQVDQLSAEIHERKKKDKDKVDCETQTEEHVWTETDYYNYYYGDYGLNSEGADTQESLNTAPADYEAAESSTTNEATAADVSVQPDQTSLAVTTEGSDGGSIADMLRATAEEAMTQTGFVFDETSGMYYDHSTGFYYDSASQLYYDANSGIYYYYDAESGRYQFHSRIEVPAVQSSAEPYQEKTDADKKGRKFKKGVKKTSQDDRVQEVTNSLAKMKISSYWKTPSYRVKDIWPPCVRVTVVRSPVLQVGTLFIITADSPATIGREKDMNHAIRIPEMGVSKFHAEVYFDQEQQSYMLVDQGSQNGTVINGNRILQPKTKSEPHALMHGDEVKMGETVLSFHIHSGNDTCDGCEPGQVMAHLSKHKREDNTGPALTKEDKESLRQKELKQMKAKYGLQSGDFEETKALKNPKYKDRAESRRQTVGSEGAFQRDDAPASVHEEISEVNKGRKMLEKMGWKKGEGLGKMGTGMKDPIQLKIRKSQSGLGAAAAMSLDDASLTKSKSQKNWEKARERFADTCQPDSLVPKTQKNTSPKAWVRSEETETTPNSFETEGQS